MKIVTMIKKFLLLQNIGRFEQYQALGGDIEMKKVTLVYAENGSGKTTLTSVIRSLKEEDKVYITERKRVGQSELPKVTILVENGLKASFNGLIWDRAVSSIYIFDSHFVNQNICSGHSVENSHKRELYRFVIGEDQVKLAKEIDDLDKQSRHISQEITAKSSEIKKRLNDQQLNIEEFVTLQNELALEQKIHELVQQIQAITDKASLKNQQILQKIITPPLEVDILINTLEKTIKFSSGQAEELVKSHIHSHLDNLGETWLRDGYKYVNLDQDNCPFCGQLLEQSKLLVAYHDFFSTEYKSLLENITSLEQKTKQYFSQQVLLQINKIVNQNNTLEHFWSEYVENLSKPEINLEKLEAQYQLGDHIAGERIAKKRQNPLSIITKLEINPLLDILENIRLLVDSYNESIEIINVKINAFKTGLVAIWSL
jgi:wobble nucleotide-excising tRNase